VAVFGGDRVTRVAADRSLTNLPARAGAKPQSLALGPDGSVWLTESGLDRLARIRNGAIEEAVATGPWPDHMVVTADGWAWFTEYNGDRVGRIRLP
jgi:streptogramin lyase